MQQQGGAHYGAPPPPPPPPVAAEAVPPISSRPPPQPQPLNFDELATAVSGSFPEDDAAASGGAAERSGGPPGNRWPRHETLALIRIRSDMDAAFREAALKGPLWEEVSRKLKEQGITRSSKKCKEKFENVHKYYKRTKEGRAGRQDGKNYRFFSELEALTGGAMNAPSRPAQLPAPPVASIAPAPPLQGAGAPQPALCGLGFSSNSDSDPDSETEDDGGGGRKRKRREAAAGTGRHAMALFGEMMRKVMEQQEAMQQRFLDVIERREQERMARDEAWRRQEAARLSREHDMAAQERSMAASRDAAIIAFLQKISDQGAGAPHAEPPQPPPKPPAQIQQELLSPMPAPPPPPPPLPLPPQHTQQELLPPVAARPPADVGGGGSGDPPSSRWPKTEVLTLIELRCALDTRYHDSGPKGPLWEEISAGMRRLGYNRNAKRCKEKWENINKYFKKVKESNKRRPDDAKTCPYFHQLDAIYRSRSLGPAARSNALPIASLPPPPPDAKPNGLIAPPPPAPAPLLPEKKADDPTMTTGIKEAQTHRQHSTAPPSLELHDSASMSGNDDDEYDDEEDDDEDAKMAYKIEFQRPNMTGAASSNGAGSNPTASVPPAATGPFVAMVQ